MMKNIQQDNNNASNNDCLFVGVHPLRRQLFLQHPSLNRRVTVETILGMAFPVVSKLNTDEQRLNVAVLGAEHQYRRLLRKHHNVYVQS